MEKTHRSKYFAISYIDGKRKMRYFGRSSVNEKKEIRNFDVNFVY